MKFEEMGLSLQLLESLQAMGFTTPTQIQEEAIPILLRGEDLIGQAKTGTGKTAAFGLPLLEAWLKRKQARHGMAPNPAGSPRNVQENARGFARNPSGIARPSSLILVPTRELAVQVHANLQKMAGNTGARAVPVYGGVDMRRQLRLFRSPVDMLVGTPGRTLDHLRQGTMDLGGVRTVVLDEADRMLDMGFIRDVVRILDMMPKREQTLLFSATMPREVAQIAQRYMRNPKTIKVSEDDLAVKGIRQLYVRSTHAQRLGMLLAAIRTEKPGLSLVFCRMKHEAKKLARVLQMNGIKADALHGNLNQNARERALAGFRSGNIQVLVATDLASRGIDVPGITHVFNYELPADPLTYVHRIGRTGRAGANGTAISLINGDPRHAVGGIERATGSTRSELILEPDTPILPKRQEGDEGNFAHRGREGNRAGGGNRGRDNNRGRSDRHHTGNRGQRPRK